MARRGKTEYFFHVGHFVCTWFFVDIKRPKKGIYVPELRRRRHDHVESGEGGGGREKQCGGGGRPIFDCSQYV